VVVVTDMAATIQGRLMVEAAIVQEHLLVGTLVNSRRALIHTSRIPLAAIRPIQSRPITTDIIRRITINCMLIENARTSCERLTFLFSEIQLTLRPSFSSWSCRHVAYARAISPSDRRLARR
jgi:hypothetical protein